MQYFILLAQREAVKGVCDKLFELGFDAVFIDCPPSLGAAVISSVAASDNIVIPIGTDRFSLRGLELSLQEIRCIRRAFGLGEPNVQVLFTKYDRRESASKESYDRVRGQYAEQLFPTPVPTSTQFSKAFSRGETIFDSGGRMACKQAYDAFLLQLLRCAAAVTESQQTSARRAHVG